jgi:hypothetical protein
MNTWTRKECVHEKRKFNKFIALESNLGFNLKTPLAYKDKMLCLICLDEISCVTNVWGLMFSVKKLY